MQGIVSVVLAEITSALCAFLVHELSALDPDWWNTRVNPNLYQRYRDDSDRPPAEKCASLDLPTLIHVLQVNWEDLRLRNPAMYESRHYARKMVAIRNRWSHVGAAAVPDDDVYRDLDTMQRFAESLGLGDGLARRVKQEKEALLAAKAQALSAPLPLAAPAVSLADELAQL
jgi:hypothetical protein